MVSDITYTILFLIYLEFVSKMQTKKADELEAREITVADYSVRVTGLPVDPVKRRELQEFFSEHWGDVVDVSVCFNDGDIVDLYQERGEFTEKIASAMASDKSNLEGNLRKQVKKLDAEIHSLKAELTKKVVCTFVTFDAEESKMRCLKQYKGNSLIAQCFMRRKYRFRKVFRLKVTPAAEPSNILFHNLKYSDLSKFLRRSATLLSSVIVMGLSFGMIFAATYYKSQTPDQNECPAEKITKQEALAFTNDETIIGCFCKGLG
eukprot:218199_1